MAYEIPVTQARAELADLINRVVYGGERVVVTRHGKPLVALVSAADLQRLEQPEAAAQAEGEQVISTVAALRPASSSTAGERRRFGIAAEHRDPGGADSGR
ncbi:type II toxin-antitoxin system Phd/YefM family antitoxin [Streptomyces sp. NPDC049555]|uniref:type II toxin-antitoxin system Phd/YefM family antitoxin n=1 Tax=unclassified Streptomyces TaxID=2593676 RepID=UPI003413838B